MDENAIAIGQRVRYWRLRRQLDRKHFADLVGRSTSWLDKIEKGERNILRLPMLERVAHALSIEPEILLDTERGSRAQRCADTVEVQGLKNALGQYPLLSDSATEPIDARRVDRQLTYAGQAWLSSHFTTVARALPRLIQDAQVHTAQAAEVDLQHASRMLVMAYRLASSMLLKYDSTDIAWLAADRAMHHARTTDDPIALARASRSVARAMGHTGQQHAAITVCTDMADKLRPHLASDGQDSVPLYGMLLLSAEITAANLADAGLTRDLHGEALRAAELVGPRHRGHHTIFGRANVEIHHVAALVRLHECGRALSYAERIDPDLLTELPAERRSCYLLDLAQAHTELGHAEPAIHALSDAEQLAPEEVQCRPVVQRLIATLLTSGHGGADQTLRQIAHRAGVAA